jgi:hypothetical protein
MVWTSFMSLRFLVLIGLLAILALPGRAAETKSLPERYLAMYLKINAAEQAERKQDVKEALADFEDCLTRLEQIQLDDPDWETALVLHRLQDVRAKILQLSPPANGAQPAGIGLRPGGVGTPRLHPNYPWKPNVSPRLFWIGEDGAKGSAWAPHWVKDNGGPDAPEDRNGYATGKHASNVNPFYVALPFNDLKHPDLAQKWLPRGWARGPRDGKPVSACKDRWVELKNASGEVCYAQWEDAGPKTNEADYVFGAAAVPTAGEPGIQVSPAVGDYLGLGDSNATVSWRFVDEADVRPGAWLKLDEQAVIYLAMHRQG